MIRAPAYDSTELSRGTTVIRVGAARLQARPGRAEASESLAESLAFQRALRALPDTELRDPNGSSAGRRPLRSLQQ